MFDEFLSPFSSSILVLLRRKISTCPQSRVGDSHRFVRSVGRLNPRTCFEQEDNTEDCNRYRNEASLDEFKLWPRVQEYNLLAKSGHDRSVQMVIHADTRSASRHGSSAPLRGEPTHLFPRPTNSSRRKSLSSADLETARFHEQNVHRIFSHHGTSSESVTVPVCSSGAYALRS